MGTFLVLVLVHFSINEFHVHKSISKSNYHLVETTAELNGHHGCSIYTFFRPQIRHRMLNDDRIYSIITYAIVFYYGAWSLCVEDRNRREEEIAPHERMKDHRLNGMWWLWRSDSTLCQNKNQQLVHVNYSVLRQWRIQRAHIATTYGRATRHMSSVVRQFWWIMTSVKIQQLSIWLN